MRLVISRTLMARGVAAVPKPSSAWLASYVWKKALASAAVIAPGLPELAATVTSRVADPALGCVNSAKASISTQAAKNCCVADVTEMSSVEGPNTREPIGV